MLHTYLHTGLLLEVLADLKTSFLFTLIESMNRELNERHQIVLLSDIKAHRVGIETEIKKWRINACQAIRVTAQ